ncbi:hypothetical protein M409DRAFT_69067 [Zasmidium cellare ATCC 36951]|uniref:Glycoside hydrolase family 43 protein n=1 Tax=Zasmidium cellare ATCC 36951 TaxID=1080233 RepID=A0A6A6C9Y3_ZASCE|nr:uncharacterized protein M409DRAFT_69067 [Zasmidium cellare ATCC 36951]KAF2162459.1 hypothetical protein M409DRAFT_69067 [Zasmidium cellare ATCC 36951]
MSLRRWCLALNVKALHRDTSFDFSPSDYFSLRNDTGNYHTGDITLRWRVSGQSEWNDVDTAAQRPNNPISSRANGSLLHSDFTNVFPQAAQHVSIVRDWKTDRKGNLQLYATLANTGRQTIEIGAFGFPLEFNNIFTNRTATDTTNKCVLVDPYIGLDAGYGSQLEAWRFLTEESGNTYYQSQVYEGNYAWQTHSLAYAENEWNATNPWNHGTSAFIHPGQSTTFALTFSPTQNVYDIESAVASLGLPVAIGIPGYVLPTDLVGKLFLQASAPVRSISVSPSGMLRFTPTKASNGAWKAYNVAASGYGRAAATITYDNGLRQTVHYYVISPITDTANRLSSFMFDEQWFADKSDPFNRAPSVIAYDCQADHQILQEQRAWIAGLSDEETHVHPVPAEVAKLEEMANEVVWGWLQDRNNDSGQPEYGVKRSVFFYDPSHVPGYTYDPSIDWTTWGILGQSRRVRSVYWGLYGAERANPGILKTQSRTWYLEKAYRTALASQALYPNGTAVTSYSDVGLIGETIWKGILDALYAEGMTDYANQLKQSMQARQAVWTGQDDPFGNEMAWDSTGQEGVYVWSKYFGDTATVTKTLNSIRGYMPTVAHWGYNGNARRYWDFEYGGKIEQIERMIHHYGSSLNALPVLGAYENNPQPSTIAALYDLRIGYGGNMGPLTNINAAGCPSTAFHSYADLMQWDGYTGDYGPNYNGHIIGATTYVVQHPDFGWLSFGGNLEQRGSVLSVTPKDTVRRRVYVAPEGLLVEFDAAEITDITYDTVSHSITRPLFAQGTVTKVVFRDVFHFPAVGSLAAN